MDSLDHLGAKYLLAHQFDRLLDDDRAVDDGLLSRHLLALAGQLPLP